VKKEGPIYDTIFGCAINSTISLFVLVFKKNLKFLNTKSECQS
jgi:hypothetical protein